MSITRITDFQSAKGKNEDLFNFLKSLIPHIRSSKGCISCDVLTNSESGDKFCVIEQWDSVDSHRKSVQSFPKEKMQSAMSLFGAPPNGSYYKKYGSEQRNPNK